MAAGRLHATHLGDAGPRLFFCHGLFGQGKNWTQIARQFADSHRVTMLDMPDHGRSPWTEEFDYLRAADLVAAELTAEDPVQLVGHSMGGKIAMLVALAYPERVDRLCVVDVAPVSYRSLDEFRGFIDGMLALDFPTLARREEADERLRQAVPDDTVRAFLLQNLRREGDGWRWQPNLVVLSEGLPALRDWPGEVIASLEPFGKPTLWIGGAESGYIRPEHAEAMSALFPKVRRVTVKGAGHWVHSEQPEIFTEVLRRFLA